MSSSWEDVRELVGEALELAPGQREEFLARRAGGDGALVREARELLAAEARAARLFASADRSRDSTLDLAEPLGAGALVGRWRLQRKLGEGGMGAVWLAQREESEQRAALKLLHLPLLTATARRHFGMEQRALARLEHPGITRLVDGGVSAAGLPYLVTEWVDGVTISAWCDGHRLSIARRVELFVHVCAAVHAAHQRLVVHGDIKPSNVLVDREGRVKLCDFGIARLLDAEDSAGTHSSSRALTPRYASPEQVRVEPITTASDVYSLGALLYELLCGVPAHDVHAHSASGLVRVVCELSPARPSAAAGRAREELLTLRRTTRGELVRALRGDLDAIAMQCLAKSPSERYSSAAELGDDLARSLRREPVRARVPTGRYLVWRFLQRHRMSAALAAAALVAVLVGLTVAWQQSRLARRAEANEAAARARAERRSAELREMATTIVFDAHDAIRNLPGATAARELLAQSAAHRLDSLLADAAGDRELERELARAYLRLGDALGRPVEANLGRTSEAESRYRTAIELAERDPGDLLLRAWARSRLADLLLHESRAEDAAELYVAALDLRLRASELVGAPPLAEPNAGYLRGQLCDVHLRLGRIEEASTHATASLELAERVSTATPADTLSRENLATAWRRIGEVELARRANEAAVAALQRAEREIAPLLAATDVQPRTRQRAAQISGDLGQALARTQDRDAARASYERAVEIHRALLAMDPRSAAFRDDLAVALRRYGGLEAGVGELESACDRLEEALDLARINHDLDPRSAKAARAFAVAADELGGVLARLERDSEAIGLHEQSLRIFADLAAAADDDATAQRGHAVSRSMLARARVTKARRATTTAQERTSLLAQARQELEQALTIVEHLAAGGRLAPSDAGVPDFLRRQLAECAEGR